MMKPFTGSISECPRCGDEHLDLHAVPFAKPPLMDETFWTHWATCPKTSEPLMIAKTKASRNYTVTWEPTGNTYVMKAVD